MFLHLLRACSDENSSRNDRFLSEVIFASIDMVLRGIPRKVSDVVGPSIFDSLTGMLSVLHNVSMTLRFIVYVSEFSVLTVKKSFTTTVALLIAVTLLTYNAATLLTAAVSLLIATSLLIIQQHYLQQQ